LNNLKEQVEATYTKLPVIKQRIEILQNLETTKPLTDGIQQKLGKKAAVYVSEQPTPENQWMLYNILTYYISHLVEKRMRAAYQMKVSRLFKL
jgi:hypothetical protein